jgi:hypothetical protein
MLFAVLLAARRLATRQAAGPPAHLQLATLYVAARRPTLLRRHRGRLSFSRTASTAVTPSRLS